MGVLSPFVRKIKDKRGSLKYTSVLFIRSFVFLSWRVISSITCLCCSQVDYEF